MGDRDDAVAADQSHRRLDTHDAVDARGTDDRSVRLCANGEGRQVRRDGDGRAARRPAGIPGDGVGIFGLSADTAPAAR